MMDRRRALMMAQIGGENMVPGKTISIETAIIDGSNVISVLNNALSAAGITLSGVAITTKKQSKWATRECVIFAIANGVVSSVYRRKANSIQALGGYTATYDITASAGQTFYVVEAVQ